MEIQIILEDLVEYLAPKFPDISLIGEVISIRDGIEITYFAIKNGWVMRSAYLSIGTHHRSTTCIESDYKVVFLADPKYREKVLECLE